jgi:FkbM family methyltransferase
MKNASLTILRLDSLYKIGFRPRVILDIGAYRGEWSQVVKRIFPESDIFMIEANADHQDFLAKIKEASGFEIACLGDNKRKNVKFYLANEEATQATGDSLFKEQTRFFQNARVRKLPMITLDYLVKKRKLRGIDLIKIDTQGSELIILKGGQKTIAKAKFIILETQNIEYNRKAPLTGEVITTMERYGYRPFDILDIHYLPTGEMSQIDILFVKKNSLFYKKGILF